MRSLVAAVLTAALAGVASAAPFQNGSFEIGPNPGSGFLTFGSGNTSITGWTVSGHSVDYIGGYWQPSQGTRSLDLNGSGVGGISQSFDTIAGQVYQVTFDLAGNPDGGPATKTMDVQATGNPLQSYPFTNTGSTTSANMGWTPFSYFFTATGSSTTLTFTSTTAAGTFFGPALDNVAVTAVPEPLSLVVFGSLVVGGIVAVRRRVVTKA